MNLDFTAVLPSIPYILEGIGITLQIVLCATIIGFLLGILLALFKIGRIKLLRWIADIYTSIFRGTPLVLQLMIIYYAIPQLLDIQIDPMPAAILAFGLNSGAYISEIIRGGINAVDKGQQEAALALGIPYFKMMKDIILPQALKNILPALMNEFITLNKESAIVTVIGALDIMRRAYVVGGSTYRYLEPLLIAGVIYYIMTLILTFLGKMLEKRMSRSD
ncbi:MULTISPECIES: amino acid ABC transporter permease [Bacillaceae]|uniref:amino acid ABC transporter permease n=1 Tax=Bacillaceae TaxID=186817 RepID=UPI0006AF9AFF|nr:MULTISPECIES: amino acid ABC transporter permease [Bacillaceae]ALC85606.1 arginine ABC transporter permease [Bacillus sp. FJAT-22090]KQL35917.1 arginine ABC transporter permease [Psychrobacillus sp. FJAT-21963]MDF2066925.1 amino acid ABC transporter permease [Bacillus sp. Cr_A10]